MDVLFLAHLNFFSPKEHSTELDWVKQFAEALKHRGFHPILFNPEVHKVQDFQIIHVFSPEEPLSWYWLKKLGKTVIVTPAVSNNKTSYPRSNGIRKWRRYLGRFCRALFQRKWPPMDQQFFYQSASHYFVSSATSDEWLTNWNIPKNKISNFKKADISQTADLAATLYKSL